MSATRTHAATFCVCVPNSNFHFTQTIATSTAITHCLGYVIIRMPRNERASGSENRFIFYSLYRMGRQAFFSLTARHRPPKWNGFFAFHRNGKFLSNETLVCVRCEPHRAVACSLVMQFHRKFLHLFSFAGIRCDANVLRFSRRSSCGRQRVAKNSVPNGYLNINNQLESRCSPTQLCVCALCALCGRDWYSCTRRNGENGEIFFIRDYEIIQMIRKYLAFATSGTLSHDSFEIIHHWRNGSAHTVQFSAHVIAVCLTQLLLSHENVLIHNLLFEQDLSRAKCTHAMIDAIQFIFALTRQL